MLVLRVVDEDGGAMYRMRRADSSYTSDIVIEMFMCTFPLRH